MVTDVSGYRIIATSELQAREDTRRYNNSR